MIGKIAHILNAPFAVQTANGVAEFLRSVAQEQARLGASVAVFSSVDGTHFSDRESPGQWIREASNASDDDALAWQPDVLHFHSVHIPRHIALAGRARQHGIPYCVTVHGGLFPAALRRGRVKKAAFNLLFERRFLRGASFVHAVSPHEVAAIRHYGYDGPVVIVPNGLPSGREALEDPDALYEQHPSLRDQRIFMFIGRLDPWQKGLDLLVEAFARTSAPESMLVLVGPDWRGSSRSLPALAQRLGILPRVYFPGPAFGDDMVRFLSSADVFLHPSRWEGLSLSVLAAAKAGKACLLTRDADPLGSLERGNAAVIVEPTVPSLTEGFNKFAALSSDELRAMGARAKQVAEAHTTWPEVAERLVHAYQNALARRGLPPTSHQDDEEAHRYGNHPDV